MKLMLHEMAHSPFCIPVRRILEACGVDYECVQVPNWDRRSLAELTGGAHYETRLSHSPFLFGDAPVCADYALLGILGNFQHGGQHRLNKRFVNLHRWTEAMEAWKADR